MIEVDGVAGSVTILRTIPSCLLQMAWR